MSNDSVKREVARLRHRREELVRRRDTAMERVALFPNPVIARQLEEMTSELGDLDRRLSEASGGA